MGQLHFAYPLYELEPDNPASQYRKQRSLASFFNYADRQIIILTGYDLPVYKHEAKKHGISGFLNKNISPDDLISSLIHVFHGGTCFPSETNTIIIEELTSMEKKILQLICSGKKRKMVASELYMSERTLSNHLQHIFEKLEVSSVIEAVTKAIQLGYISPL